MPSSEKQTSVNLRNANALTTSYGDGGSGWVSKGFDVRAFEQVSLELDITKATLSKITLKLQQSTADRLSADDNDFSDVWKVGSDGAAALEEIEISPSGDGKVAVRVDCRAAAYLRVSAKGDVADGRMNLAVLGEYAKSTPASVKLDEL